MIELAHPWVLVALPLPLLVMWLIPAHRRKLPATRLPFFQRLVEAAGITPSSGTVITTRSLWITLVGLLCWVLIVLAASNPQRVSDPITWQSAARDLILAVDISGSMDEKDFANDKDSNANGSASGEDGANDGAEDLQRLAGVKQVIADFLNKREGERLSLIVFGTRAFVQAPLTEDLDTLQRLLDSTEVGMAGPHTALGDAIGLAIRQFESSNVEQRLLILLSDGADTGSRMDPINAAQIAADRGVRIVTIAIGDPDGDGENRVDQATLQAIAQRTDGTYFSATDQQALEQVYASIDELAPRKINSESYRERRSLADWPLAAAALIILGILIWRASMASRRRHS
ncbi:VWA domain-containing protein [Halomonas huangheensis]|uniref:VWFA domain-containing protein n=1 Tax=Halomonas huangheensis TaxID=1178482 RepID=W1N4V3_9GAMM|nr:VWA domain-containing protein [Halomonas huangheensis]ALM51703.1 hypothetical protein AR456_04935 [Halomonas huangheensis]ERL50196.1 hypothetical protein BJB45_03455 [Halomonas huangheensis]